MLIHSEVVSFFTNISRNRRRGAKKAFLENFEFS
ncbi:hypothetical protein T4B_10943 [Trichinella pseudospiralis]|uniref:Uncharacterized protein n=1 Tax=Trichinella pseudospiralis TaxID=6337 RepID=A0A0V1GCF8_TRIPS|nr:hypothetical protein T4A_6975 [Trichinella pseudospiralis]KRY95829.1 hypothetical protein T4B_10943 [Trichinella pseudospiralis]KRY98933.1 hypothetical protein T4C_10662 [Trichinella pseudospiralis]